MRRAVLMMVLLFLAVAVQAEPPAKNDDADKVTVHLERWLALGPGALPLPVFHDEERGAYGVSDLLTAAILPPADAIRAGEEVSWLGPEGSVWRSVAAAEDGLVALQPVAGPGGSPQIAWLAAVVRARRFHAVDVEILGGHPRRLVVDGKDATSGGAGKGGDTPSEVKGKLDLTPGTHLLLVQTVRDPDKDEPWAVGVSLASSGAGELELALPPERDLDILDVLDRPDVTDLALSPDGERVAVSLRRTHAGSADTERWIEVRSAADGSLRRAFRGGFAVSDVAWAPQGHKLSYLAEEKGSGDKKVSLKTLWLADLDTGAVEPLLERVDKLQGYLWSPSGDALAYWTEAEAKKDSRGVKFLDGLLDRQRDYRDKSYLWLLRPGGGVRVRLTAGELSSRAAAFSPDGGRLLFTRQIEDVADRPYTRRELWELDTATLEAAKLRDFRWLDDASYAPDGQRLLVVAGPSAFDGAGISLPEGMVPNDGDGQLYIWDPKGGEVEALTRDFDPSVGGALWSRADGGIYLSAGVGDTRRLFRYDPDSRAFSELPLGPVVVSSWAVAEKAAVVAASATGPWRPEAVWAVSIARGNAELVLDTAESWYSPVRRGQIQEWDCTTSQGKLIPGRIYLPPDFDPQRRYPTIVYYYAGTSPVSRDFGGRYPKEWWASLGYVVYVPQPSGSTGYGQLHSALHVNEWGGIVVDEIIEATRAYLAAHSWADAERLGCIGASYGGFTTMLLLTRTDMFAAGVSHAGISSISSYWGEGYWGYLYNARSAAGSFPWNNRELYVERSALFNADAIKTPLLLTHGTGDTNVPVGESDSLYIALKLLGSPVEYLQVDGQNHWILEHDKRVVWSQAIVAWFDRWLKGQPQWWEEIAKRQEKKQ